MFAPWATPWSMPGGLPARDAARAGRAGISSAPRPREALTVLSGLLILLAASASLLHLPELVSTSLYALAMLAGGYHIVLRAYGSLRTNRELDINVLMTIAAIGAALIGEWSEGAVVVFLFSLGEMLEGYTMDQARGAIRGLLAAGADGSDRASALSRLRGTSGSTLAGRRHVRGRPVPVV